MTAGTYSRYGQALAIQTLAVNGHGKVFEDIMFANIMGQSHGAAFLMAATACIGNI